MTVLRFKPEQASPGFGNEGLYSLGAVWAPQQVPVSGDTVIVDHGTLDIPGSTINGISLFVISASSNTSPTLAIQSTTLSAGTSLVLDSRALATAITVQVTYSLLNAGVIDVLGLVSLIPFANAAAIVNSGTINLYAGFINTSLAIENDGIINVGNSALTTFGSRIIGNGSIVLKSGSDVETTSVVSSTQQFKFLGGTHANSILQVDSPTTFRSSISGFSASDTILLKFYSGATTTTSYAFTGLNSGVLTITTGGVTASLNFAGSYTLSDFTISGTRAGISVTTSRTDQGVADTSPVYRFFDTSNGTHFFTASAAERDSVVNSRTDLQYEGTGLNATDKNGPSATPVYRFFDTHYGTHFYTASSTERDGVVATRSDLQFEGIGFYGDVSQQPGDSAVYRFFDSNYGTHFYTANAAEAVGIQATRTDLKYEGVGFYSAI